MRKRYLIIGNSIAGTSCVEGIREFDEKGEIIMISDEGVINYSRPLISHYLAGKMKEESMSFKDERFYKDKKIELILNTRVKTIIPKRKRVILQNGKELKFDKLLISTGGKPIIPPIDGLNKIREGIFTFTKLDDAKSVIKYIESENITHAVVLGAGLIGLKCTEGLCARGLHVTIVELADRILANTFDKDASNLLETALSKWGCRIIKENTIVKVKGEKRRLRSILLRNGEEIETNLLIIAIGVQPDTSTIESSNIKVDRGILVDEKMETNVKNIYAAGDVAQGLNYLTKSRDVIAIWPIASRQGRIAGTNMAGGNAKYSGLFPMNSVELGGIPTISFGITNPSGSEYEILVRKEETIYKKIVLRENRIVGAIFLGKIERAGILFGLIKKEVNVKHLKEHLLSDDPQLLFLDEKTRRGVIWQSVSL